MAKDQRAPTLSRNLWFEERGQVTRALAIRRRRTYVRRADNPLAEERMYHRLDGTRITETLERLQRRIDERFPGSGLSQVAGELLSICQQARGRAARLARPQVAVRAASWSLIAVLVVIAAGKVSHLRLAPRWPEFATFLQSS